MSTATRQRPREDITVLAKVEMDRRLSTPWDEVWRARSDRDAERVYAVRHHIDPDRWTCECPGFLSHGRCKHVARCKRRRLVAWYNALWLGFGPEDLRRERASYRLLEAAGFMLGEESLCALDALSLLLGEEEAEAA